MHEKRHISAKKGTLVTSKSTYSCTQWHLHDTINMVCQQPGYFPEVREKIVASILVTQGPIPEMLVTGNAKACNDGLTQNPKWNTCDQGHPFQFQECFYEQSGQTYSRLSSKGKSTNLRVKTRNKHVQLSFNCWFPTCLLRDAEPTMMDTDQSHG